MPAKSSKRIIHAKELEKITFAYATPAAEKWWERNKQKINDNLIENAKKGFRFLNESCPKEYAFLVISKLLDEGYLANTSAMDDKESHISVIKILW